MAQLLPEIQEHLKQAMRDKATLKLSTLRMLVSDIKKFQIDKKQDATAEDILTIITKMVKQRQDAAQAFDEAKRTELADKERQEIIFLQAYLPEPLSETEIKTIISDAITTSKAETAKDMGKVMGLITAKLKGRADMGQVSKWVREQLS